MLRRFENASRRFTEGGEGGKGLKRVWGDDEGRDAGSNRLLTLLMMASIDRKTLCLG